MSSEWKVYELGELGTIITGKTPSSKVLDAFGVDVPFVTPSDMDERKWIDSTKRYLSQFGAGFIKSSRVPQNSIAVSCIGSDMGKARLLMFDSITNQQINTIIPDVSRFDSEYIYYNLLMKQHEFKFIASGSATPILSKAHFSKIKISCPSLLMQKKIVSVFKVLDDKIDLIRKMNKTLESIAQTLFKSWFVDFDPVRSKAEGRQPEGMGAETAALFPDSFEESELGLVPKGWGYSTVGEVFGLVMGQSPPGDTYNQNGKGLPFYQGSTDFGFRFPSKRVYCDSPVRLAESGDILISVRAPVGDINVALEKCCLGRGVAAVRHPESYQSFVLYVIKHMRSYLVRYQNEGTVFGSINKKDLEKLSVIVSSVKVAKKFDELISPLDDRIRLNEEKIRTLVVLRDTLLPRLISGQLRLNDTQETIETCL